jgi:Mrp family chromosome partitioning ATPase
MAELFRTAAERYDAVVIDSPPILSVADTEGLASHPGIDVIVVARPSTKRAAIVKTMRKLELIEARVVGLVLNGYGTARSYGYG